MSQLEEYIKKNGSLKQDEVDEIAIFFEPAELKKGDYFGRTGKYCDKLSFIQTGYVRVFVELQDREVTQWISPSGYFMTDLSSFTSGSPGRWNIQALTDCTLSEITRTKFDALEKKVPVWKDLYQSFIVNCFTLLENRIFNHLYMSTEERFQHLMKTQPELFNFVPLQYLASMLGMTPETLSRLRKKQLL